MQFPRMASFRQRFDAVSVDDVGATVVAQLDGAGLEEAISPGSRSR